MHSTVEKTQLQGGREDLAFERCLRSSLRTARTFWYPSLLFSFKPTARDDSIHSTNAHQLRFSDPHGGMTDAWRLATKIVN